MSGDITEALPQMKSPAPPLSSRHVFLLGTLLMALSWLADAGIDAAFEEGAFLRLAFAPNRHDLAIRLLFLGVQFGFLLFILTLLDGHRRIAVSLEAARLQAENEKAASASVLEAVGDAITILDPELKILYQNRAQKALMGEHVGEACYRGYQGRDEPCEGCNALLSLRDGETRRVEKVGPTLRGPRHIEIVTTPLRDAGGAIVAGIEAVRDITERRLVDERLRMQLSAMEAAMDGIAIFDAAAGYRYLNRAHLAIYGYDDPEELLGKSWRVFYEEGEAARLETEAFSVLFEQRKWSGEATGKRRDGSTFAQEVSLTALDDGGIICVVRDVTDRKKAEVEILRANLNLEEKARELESFSYSLAHDLRGYLTRVSVAAQLLRDDHGDILSGPPGELVKAITESESGMEELIEAILVLSSVSRQEMHREAVNLSNIVQRIESGLRMLELGRRVEMIVAPDVVAEADPHLVKVLLENLVGNAWKYTGEAVDARIEFGESVEEGERVFHVRDNGVGFDAEKAEAIFEPFQRLQNATRFPGTGIGLATVQRIVHRHGGKVWATGEPGKGATFRFTLEPPPGAGLQEQ